MALYVDYATLADLAAFLKLDLGSLPSDSDRLITRCSELVKQSTMNNIISTNENHMEAAKLAVCAQVEFIITSGESSSIAEGVKSFSLGDLSMDYNGQSKPTLSPRARSFLSQQYLLYRGFGACDYPTQNT